MSEHFLSALDHLNVQSHVIVLNTVINGKTEHASEDLHAMCVFQRESNQFRLKVNHEISYNFRKQTRIREPEIVPNIPALPVTQPYERQKFGSLTAANVTQNHTLV